MEKLASYFRKTEDGAVCELCPHACRVKEGKSGICRVRYARDGELYSENYGEISSLGIDPIEKKPLFHFRPGKSILSCGSYGCNFSCGYCQNYSIAHLKPITEYIGPEQMAEKAAELSPRKSVGLAFTYNEPTVFYEEMMDTAKICKAKGLDVVVVTNGYINAEPLEELLPYVDAMNIDLKSFSEDFYRKVCGGSLSDVLRTIERANKSCHVELTTLAITGYNDSDEEMEELSGWISELDRSIPLHISRYHPTYKFNEPPTPVERISKLAEIAKQKLDYVYIGNVGNVDNNTYCPNCGNTIVERDAYSSTVRNSSDICGKCGEQLNIVI